MVECYLKIQDYRFHDRITSHIEVDLERIHGILVMPLLIQPFIENAFIHGLESEINGMITIRVIVVEDVYITIEDNGCGMSKEKIEEVNKLLNDFDNLDRTHIGICNVNQRIKLKYGDEYGVSFDSELGKGTRVTIVFPAIYDERCS